MKKCAAVLLGCLLTFNFVAIAETKEADQKWLVAVEKMVTKGEKKISTPSEERANLLKQWADKKGYVVKATKTERGFSLELTPKETSKPVARN